MAKRQYVVSIPITGTATFIVDAEDEDSAEAAAWEAADNGDEADVKWEFTKRIVQGNIFHGMQNEVEVSPNW